MAVKSRRTSRKTPPRTRPNLASRAEVNHILRIVLENAAALDKLRDEQHLQFRRIAQLQAELDTMKQALDKARPVL